MTVFHHHCEPIYCWSFASNSKQGVLWPPSAMEQPFFSYLPLLENSPAIPTSKEQPSSTPPIATEQLLCSSVCYRTACLFLPPFQNSFCHSLPLPRSSLSVSPSLQYRTASVSPSLCNISALHMVAFIQ